MIEGKRTTCRDLSLHQHVSFANWARLVELDSAPQSDPAGCRSPRCPARSFSRWPPLSEAAMHSSSFRRDSHAGSLSGEVTQSHHPVSNDVAAKLPILEWRVPNKISAKNMEWDMYNLRRFLIQDGHHDSSGMGLQQTKESSVSNKCLVVHTTNTPTQASASIPQFCWALCYPQKTINNTTCIAEKNGNKKQGALDNVAFS